MNFQFLYDATLPLERDQGRPVWEVYFHRAQPRVGPDVSLPIVGAMPGALRAWQFETWGAWIAEDHL